MRAPWLDVIDIQDYPVRRAPTAQAATPLVIAQNPIADFRPFIGFEERRRIHPLGTLPRNPNSKHQEEGGKKFKKRVDHCRKLIPTALIIDSFVQEIIHA